MKISPLVPAHFPDMPEVKGLEIKTYEARVVYKNRDDLLLVKFAQGTQVAGVFTKSRTRSASVEWCVKHLATGSEGRLLMVNSGNSNAFTGAAGERSVTDMLAHLAAKFSIKTDEIYTSSTGVIGELLSGQALLDVVDADKVSRVDNAYIAAADAIKTTDTFS